MVALEKPMAILVARVQVAVVRVRVRAVRGVAPVLELFLVMLQSHQRRKQAIAGAASVEKDRF